MASRRMFSSDFIFSDRFAELPHAGQVLYFNLMGCADDDGFVSRPNRVTSDCNCTQEDLELLCQKEYLIKFDSGIVVIRHWFLHNRIRKDRYTETIFLEEKEELEIKNGVYEPRNNSEMVLESKKESKEEIESSKERKIKTEEKPLCGIYFEDPETQMLFIDFIHQRKEMGCPDVEKTIQMMVNQINGLTVEQQQETLKDAIRRKRKYLLPEKILEKEILMKNPQIEKSFNMPMCLKQNSEKGKPNQDLRMISV